MTDQEIIEALKKENEEFKKLSDEHKDLERLLTEIDRKVHLNSDEEMERKRIQKLKLLKKDKMAELVRDYKKSHSN